MVMLIVVGSIVMGLTSMASNDLNNTTHFKSAQAMDSTLNTAAETALSNIRYNFEPQTLNVSPPAPCWVPASSAAGYPDAQVTTTVDAMSYAVDAWCSTIWVPLSNKTRVVTISLCPATVSAIKCGATPWLQAIVTFDDYALPIGTSPERPVHRHLWIRNDDQWMDLRQCPTVRDELHPDHRCGGHGNQHHRHRLYDELGR